MKNSSSIFFFFFLAFFAGKSFGQVDTMKQQLPQGQDGWYQQNSGTTEGLTVITFVNKDTGYAGPFYTTNGGNQWLPYPHPVNVAGFIDPLHGWGASSKGAGWIAITTDGGASWNDYNSGFEHFGRVQFCTSSLGACYKLANSTDGMGFTTDGGKTWTDAAINPGIIGAFGCFDSLHIIAGGRNYPNPDKLGTGIESIFLSSDGGASWKFSTTARIVNAGCNAIAVLDSQIVLIVGDIKASFRSVNRGYSFQPILFPNDTAQNALLGVSASDNHNATIVGATGRIFRSYDGGLSWKKQSSGTNADLYAVFFIDSLTGWIVGDGGIILHTTNAGYSWVRQYLPTPLEVKVTPEPFTTKTTLSYSIPKPAKVSVKVYDMTGREVYHIATDGIQSQGQHSIELSGAGLSAGVYYFLLVAGEFTGMGKFTKIVP